MFQKNDSQQWWAAKNGVVRVTSDLVLSIVVLTALALLAGAFALWRRTGDVKNPALMVLLALIAIGNVLIWTIPTADGTSPLDKAGEVEAETAGTP